MSTSEKNLPPAAGSDSRSLSATAAHRGEPSNSPAFALVATDVVPVEDAIDPQNPWPGLASFTEEARAFFHGRDEEVAELARRVQRKLLTVLFGQSGLGKTSILRAGIVPRLRPEGYCPVYVRLDYSRESPPPSEQIKQAVLRATQAAGRWTQPGVSEAGESLWEFLHHRDDTLRDQGGRALIPLLIFDQFEEIFTLAQGDDFGRQRAAQFLEDLADLVENRPPRALEARLEHDDAAMERFDFTRADYRLLIALREDYLAHIEGLKSRMPSVTQNRMRLARMTGTQALSAVTGPGGALVNAEVARAIVSFVAGGAELERAEVEPSLLSLVCRELNHARLAQGRGEISADLLAGSRDTILLEFYERALADQPPGVRAFIEDELLTDSGYRESIAEERVKKGFAAAGAAPGSVAALIDRRLLRVEERLDIRRVELTHDVLCGIVKASRDVRHERESKVAIERQLAATRGQQEATRRALWRARKIAAACAILALGAIASSIYGYTSQRRAEAAERQALAAAERAQASAAEAMAARRLTETARTQAEQLLTYVVDDLWRNLEPLGRLDLVRGLSGRVIDYYEGLPDTLRNANARLGLATILAHHAVIAQRQGDLDKSESAVARAFSLVDELKKANPDDSVLMTAEILCHYSQARNSFSRSRFHDAAAAIARAVAIAGQIISAPGATEAQRKLHAWTLGRSGFYLMRDNRWTEAIAAFEASFAAYRVLGVASDKDLVLTSRFAEDLSWAAEALDFLGRTDEAEQLANQACTVAERVIIRSPDNRLARFTIAVAAGRLHTIANRRFQPERALEWNQRARSQYETLLAIDPTNTIVQNNLEGTRFQEGLVYLRLGRHAEGERALEEAVRLEPEAKVTSSRASLLMSYRFQIAAWYQATGEPQKAAAHRLEAQKLHALRMADVQGDSIEAVTRREQPRSFERVLDNTVGEHERVIASAQETLRNLAGVTPRTSGDETTLRDMRFFAFADMARALAALDRWSDVETAAREALAAGYRAERHEWFRRVNRARAQALLALSLAKQGRHSEAAESATPAVDLMRQVIGSAPAPLDWRFTATSTLIAAAHAETDTTKRAALVREARETFAPTAAYPNAPERHRLERELDRLHSASK